MTPPDKIRIRKKDAVTVQASSVILSLDERRAKLKRELAHMTNQLARLKQRADELSKEADMLL
jgi:prefoldin subunit 5